MNDNPFRYSKLKKMYPILIQGTWIYRDKDETKEHCVACDEPLEDNDEVLASLYYEMEGITPELFHNKCVVKD